jgi:DNA-binding GntR family transcriptional regulator
MEESVVGFSEFLKPGSFSFNDHLRELKGSKRSVRNNLSDYVMDFVVDKILTGEYLPDSRIDPKEIAQTLDISQMPIRDALEKLEERGWIVRYPQRGTFVKKVAYSDLVEISQVRTMIEVEAVRSLIENYNTTVIEKLRQTICKIDDAIQAEDLESYEQYDTLFHHQIVSSTGNRRMIDLFHTVYSQVRYYFIFLVWNSEEVRRHNSMDLRYVPISHNSIFKAIEVRDIQEATELLRVHLRKGAERHWETAKRRNMAENDRND